MKKVLGIFRGFPGLGRVVAGISLLEELHKNYHCEIKCYSYLQGRDYLLNKGYSSLVGATNQDISSIGLIPTNKVGAEIHSLIIKWKPDLIIIDGEPLMLQSIKISYPSIKIVALLNPADIQNQRNDKWSMDFFNFLYNLADLSIVHGLHSINTHSHNIICTNTIIRPEVTEIAELQGENIYCILGGGTENVDLPFQKSTIKIARKCIELAKLFQDRKIHILCSSYTIYSEIENEQMPINVILHPYIEDATAYYTDAKLIICRAGRNTISEVAYLGLPTIAFISGGRYRSSEQLDNAQSQKFKNIEIASNSENLKEIAEKLIKQGVVKNDYIPGNVKAINEILKLL